MLARLAALLLLAPTLAFAQGFVEQDGAFVWQRDNRVVRFDKGRWSAGVQGGKTLSFHTFMWHDAYLYETLQGGKVEAGPTLQADGSLTMNGTFSARESSAPLRYWLKATPSAEGVTAHFEFEKSAALKLTSGVWLHLFADRKTFDGTERVWADPAGHGKLSAPSLGASERLLVELQEGLSLCLTPGGFHEVNVEGSKGAYVMRMNLVSGDFPEGRRVAADLGIGFAAMPASFPGEIKPQQQPLAIRQVTPNLTTVPRFEKLELAVDLGATYDNPFDPDDVALDADFTAPSGKRITVPGFFMVQMRREIRNGNEVMAPEGNGVWRVRFAPNEVGKWTWTLRLKDRTGTVSGGQGTCRCVAGKSQGFLRVSKADPHYLAFDDGSGFFAIGHNLPGYHASRQLAETAMHKFAAAGENYNRWWLYSYNLGIEWTDKLGWYKQDAAARMDLALDWGKQLGLYYMMCLDTHQDFREGGWDRNPFNVKNGGPCEKAGEFFTNEQARTYYKKRLRYQVARWGYSPSVLCWEFGNEIEGWADSTDAIKLPWTREMSDTLNGMDPYRHLITTSFWSHTGPPEYWALPNIDIVQTHLYTNNDGNVAEPVRQMSLKQWQEFAKPHIFGEFGIRSHASTVDKDPKGWGLHNALWAGLTSFCAGGPMPWWHENYIDPLDLYFHFTALANFSKGLPLGTARWAPLEALVEFQDKTRPPDTLDATVLPISRWGKPEDVDFTLQDDGNLADGKRPQQLLQGLGHQDLKAPVAFHVTFPQAGQFVMHIGRVSNSGLVRVWLDGQQVKELDLPCGEGLGKSSVWREQWKLWETTYDQDYSFDIPAGPHEIKLENFGKDWVSVDRYTFTGCQVRRTPNVIAAGMQAPGVAILWLQNGTSDWFNHGQGQVPPVDPVTVTLSGLPDGQYAVEWWETWKGSLSRTDKMTVRQGKLLLRLPELKTDVALKLKKVGK
ncbi:DUF5060 domain-containing protein [bacterium]|nr:DUF5060 domain-containing protein [bacterium]